MKIRWEVGLGVKEVKREGREEERKDKGKQKQGLDG
jgi:hypothetical protein